MKKYVLFAALSLCFGALSTSVARAQTANGNTIYACYNKTNGDLRKVSGPGQCKTPELPISWNVAGTPGLSARMVPPCSSTRCFVIAMPNPSPACRLVVVWSACRNSSGRSLTLEAQRRKEKHAR